MVEEFREIGSDFDNYQITNLGRIWSKPRNIKARTYRPFKGKFLTTPTQKQNGYKTVILRKNNKSYCVTVHSLIAKAFIPNPNNNLCVNHIDGNKLNNSIKNLEWCTHKENHQHAGQLGLKAWGESHGGVKLDNSSVLKIRMLITKGLHYTEIAKKFNVTPPTIRDIATGITWRHLT